MIGLELLFVSVQNHLSDDSDALVCVLHWNMLHNGYKCIGLGDKAPESIKNLKRSEVLPSGWNADPNAFSLLYLPNKSTECHVLKVIRLEGTLLVHLMKCSDNTVVSCTLNIDEYTNGNRDSFESCYKNIEDLQKRFSTEIVNQMNPSSKDKVAKTRVSQPGRSDPLDADPLRIGPRHGGQPRADLLDPDHPLAVGRGDLDPLAGGRGGGMYMDPRGLPGMGGRNPEAGLPGRLPPGAVPPGARFDPFGPPDPDMPSNPRGGHRAGPDPDHLPPPGYDDMFM